MDEGTHKQLILRAGIYRHLYDIQFRDDGRTDRIENEDGPGMRLAGGPFL